MARLVLINGAPGSGKSTLTQMYAETHSLTLALDIDVVRAMLGCWLDQLTQAGLTLTDPVEASTRNYTRGPFAFSIAGRFAEVCLATVTDPMLPGLPLIGADNQVENSTDVLEHSRHCCRFASSYTPWRLEVKASRFGELLSLVGAMKTW